MDTNLIELINKDRDQIDSYLSDVTPEQFVKDVKVLINCDITNNIIESTIDKLQKLLK